MRVLDLVVHCTFRKEHVESNFQHPRWEKMKRSIEQELWKSSLSEKKRKTPSFNVPIDIPGFGVDHQIRHEDERYDDRLYCCCCC